MTNKSRQRARGTHANPDNRYHRQHAAPVDDGWPGDGQPPPDPRTHVQSEHCRKLISYNQSPDIPFDRSINPYRGCEHGCIYCYARPSHAWLDLSPGLDFETRLFSKRNASETLLAELAKSRYRPAPIALGVNTDAYQPIEKSECVTLCEAFDGTVTVLHAGHTLDYRILATGEPPIPLDDEKSPHHSVDQARARQQANPKWKPPADHPWRRPINRCSNTPTNTPTNP